MKSSIQGCTAAVKSVRTWAQASLLSFILGLFSPLMAQGTQDEQASFDFAQSLFNDTSYANAAQEFRRFIVHFPTSDRIPVATLRLGESYFLSGQYRETIKSYQEFIDKHPNHLEVATAMRRRAQTLQRLEEYTKAGTAFQEVHAAFPGGEYASQDLLNAGNNFHQGQALDAAESALRTLIARYPRSSLIHEATYKLGRVLLDANRPEEALGQFRTLSEFPGATERKPDAFLEIGKVALVQADLKEAERIFSQLRKTFPRSASAETSYLVLARWFSDRDDWQRAADIYEKARPALPRDERRQQVVLGLADAYRKLGRSADAHTLYTQFLKSYSSSPFLARARLGFARAFANLKDYRRALEAFKLLQEKFPDTDESIQAYRDMGDIWRKLETPRKALIAYRAYADRIEGSESKASALLRIARIYEEDLGWYDRASESYRELLNNALPEYASEGQFGLARSFEKTGHPNLALREYRTYLKEFSDGAYAAEAETRIQILREFAPGDGQVRTDGLLALIAGLPSIASDPEAQFRLGNFLYLQRNYREAAERFEAALSGERPPPFASEATYLLGETYLKLARKSRLESRPKEAKSWQSRGLTAHQNLVSQYPESEWTDEAMLALIEEELKGIEPDSARAGRMLEAYQTFQETYPKSNRLDFALLRTADAHLLLDSTDPARISKALKTYRLVQKHFPQSPLKEQAAYRIGVCQARQKDYIQAEETLRTFLFEFPHSDLADHAQFQLGRILLEREYHQSAAEEFSELLTAPSSLELERKSRELLAESYFRRAIQTDELEDFHRAIQIDESLLQRGVTPAVYRRLARAYEKSGQKEKAVQTYTAFLRTFPNAADADSIAFTRAELLSYLGRTPESISAFQEFTKKYSISPLRDEARRTVGDLLFQTKNYADALKVYRGIPAEARNETVAGREVLSLFRLRRIKEAQKKTKAFKKDYRNAPSWLALFDVEGGKSYLKAGNPKQARKVFNDVIKKYPGTEAMAEARFYLSQALYKEGRAEDYLVALATFIKNHPDNSNWSSAQLELAELYFKDEDYPNASRAYQSLLANELSLEEKPKTLTKLIQIHRNLKFYDTAVGFARQLVREFPHHSLATEARIQIGELLHAKGDYQQAIQELVPLRKLVKKDNWSSVQFAIAESYQGLGDYESAKREFLKMIYNPQGSVNWIASAYYKIADCFEAQGNYPKAIHELETIQNKFGSTSDWGSQAGRRIRELEAKLDGNRRPDFSR